MRISKLGPWGHLFAGLVLLLIAGAAKAEDRPVVVELFTSQGCDACPPADAFLRELASRDEVVVLAFHVDYWDYIGWEDSFGSPQYTARQRGYAKAADRKMVYTPQMIINGADHVVGTRLQDVADLIEKHQSRGDNGISVEIERDEGRIRLRAEANPPRDMPLLVQLVQYDPEETVAIERGENAGKTITYVNIVTKLREIAQWNGRDPLDLSFDLNDDAPAVILLQYTGFGTIEAVARLR